MPSSSPVPFLMARSMLSHGMFSALAASIAVRRRGLPPASPPPALAEIVISRIRRVNSAPRLASVTAFLCLTCFHLLWPAIDCKVQLDRPPTPRLEYSAHAPPILDPVAQPLHRRRLRPPQRQRAPGHPSGAAGAHRVPGVGPGGRGRRG